MKLLPRWAASRPPRLLVLDPFAGSCNTLHWILRHLPGSVGLGFELDPIVFDLTRRNPGILGQPIELLLGDSRTLLAGRPVPAETALVVFVAPPWGTALDERTGLDLRRTSPPVLEILAHVLHRYPTHRVLFGVQVYERLEPDSVREVRALLDTSEVHVYRTNREGRDHGLLVGARGWPRR